MNSFSVSLQLLLCLVPCFHKLSCFLFFSSSSYVAVIASLWSGFRAAMVFLTPCFRQPWCHLLLPSGLEASTLLSWRFPRRPCFWASAFFQRRWLGCVLSFNLCIYSVACAGRAHHPSRQCCCNRKFPPQLTSPLPETTASRKYTSCSFCFSHRRGKHLGFSKWRPRPRGQAHLRYPQPCTPEVHPRTQWSLWRLHFVDI